MRVIHRVHNAARRIRSRIEESNDGFTLIELIVVIAILGILIAIAVPTIRGFLENSKEQAYDADQRVIQLAVDAYYFSPRNERYNNERQFPIEGKHQDSPIQDDRVWQETNARLYLDKCDSDAANSPIEFDDDERYDEQGPPEHPTRGTKGGTPIWKEGTGVFNDDVRNDPSQDKGLLYCPPRDDADDDFRGGADRFDHWEAVVVTTQGEACNPVATGGCIVISSRDYIIDFCELVWGGFIEDIPKSASADHDHQCDGVGSTDSDETPSPDAERGSYTWFVNDAGKVQSLYYFLPTDDRTGYRDVYP